MKRIVLYILLVLTALSASACMNTIENDLDVIERRIAALEEKCTKLNDQIASLRQVVKNLETYDFITKIETIIENGKTAGYRIYFTHSDPVTLRNGTDAGSPVIGVAKGSDGLYYWTVLYPGAKEPEFVRNNYGQLMPASAASPELKIENGNWFVTYDGGKNWIYLSKATADDGTSFFSSIEAYDDYVLFKLINGMEIKVPTWSSYEKLIQACEVANQNLATFTALQQALEQKVYASDIQPIVENGNTIGYRLYLSDGTSYAFYNGTATNAPVIGSARDSKNPTDKSYYWTIQYSGQSTYSWLLDEKGKKIRADASSGQSVQLTVLPFGKEGKYYWAVAYGDAEPEFLLYNGEKVEASAQLPDGVVTMVVKMEGDRVFILLSSNQYVYVPLSTPIEVTLDAPVTAGCISMNASETLSFACHVTGATDDFELLPVARDGFYAIAVRNDMTTWTITVTSPASFAAPATSPLNLLISNGRGTLKTVTVTILHK